MKARSSCIKNFFIEIGFESKVNSSDILLCAIQCIPSENQRQDITMGQFIGGCLSLHTFQLQWSSQKQVEIPSIVPVGQPSLGRIGTKDWLALGSEITKLR